MAEQNAHPTGRHASPARASRRWAAASRLYVHIPWCIRKCPYCDSIRTKARGDVPEDAYVDALVTDLEARAAVDLGPQGGRASSWAAAHRVFFPPSSSTVCWRRFRARVALQAGGREEITLEGQSRQRSSDRKFADYYAGLASIGCRSAIQSFDPRHLARGSAAVHDADEGARTRRRIRADDLRQTFNFDLMYAFAGADASPNAAAAGPSRRPLAFAAAASFVLSTDARAQHALFHRHPPGRCGRGMPLGDIEDAVHETLASAGYHHYENGPP